MVSFPPVINMLKFTGWSRPIRGRVKEAAPPVGVHVARAARRRRPDSHARVYYMGLYERAVFGYVPRGGSGSIYARHSADRPGPARGRHSPLRLLGGSGTQTGPWPASTQLPGGSSTRVGNRRSASPWPEEPRVRLFSWPTLGRTCSRDGPGSAVCVQNLGDSRCSAIHATYRASPRSSSTGDPRYPSLRVV